VKVAAAAKPAIKKAAPKVKVAAAKQTAAAAPARAKVKAASTPAKAPAAAPAVKSTPAVPLRRRDATTGAGEFKPYRREMGEDYMNEAQKQHFRNILLDWKSELMSEVDRTVSHMKDEAANFPDPADRATQEEEFSLELRTRDRERKLIKKIESTLERIDQDDYGWCDSCGVEIGIQRLEARPTATLCIDCKTLDEIKEKQERG